MNNFFVKLKNLKDKRIFHVTLIGLIIISILMTSLYIILEYDEKGENYKNLPYIIEKANIISSISSEDISETNDKWEFLVSQTNDIYLYITKNEEYTKQEDSIKQVILNNFQIVAKNSNNFSIYKPNPEDNLFKDDDNLKITELEYFGAKEQNLSEDKILNTGDVIKFRIVQEDIYKYVADIVDNKVIDYNLLLKNSDIKEEELEFNICFDVLIVLNSNKTYKTQITLDLPISGFKDNGKSFKEISQKQLIYKRQ